MAEEEIVDEEETTEEPEDVEEEPKDGDDPYKDLTLDQALERLRKADRLIIKNKRTEAKKQTTSKPQGEEMPDWAKKAEEREMKRDFAEEHNLSKAQTEAVFRYNGGTAPDEETLALPEVQAMIKALGSKDRVVANTPKGRNAPVHKGKTFAEIATDSSASKEDKNAAFEATKKRHGIA